MTQKICFDCFHKLFPDKPIRKITLGRQCVVCKAQTDRTEQMVPVEAEDIPLVKQTLPRTSGCRGGHGTSPVCERARRASHPTPLPCGRDQRESLRGQARRPGPVLTCLTSRAGDAKPTRPQGCAYGVKSRLTTPNRLKTLVAYRLSHLVNSKFFPN